MRRPETSSQIVRHAAEAGDSVFVGGLVDRGRAAGKTMFLNALLCLPAP
jgi:hypothetical protein